MPKIGKAFTFVPPIGWGESRRGAMWVYRRRGRELAISFWPLRQKGSAKKRAAALAELMQAGLKAFARDLKNTNLRVTVPLSRVRENCLEFWVQSLSTREGAALACSAVVRSTLGILMASLEGPDERGSFPIFIKFLRSVRKAPAS